MVWTPSLTIYCWIVTLLFYVLDQECCKIPGGLTNDNIGRCKEAICGEGLECGYDGFDDIKLALCGTDYQGKILNELNPTLHGLRNVRVYTGGRFEDNL